MRINVRRSVVALTAFLFILALGAGYYAWSIDRQYDKARDQADLVKSRLSAEDGSPALNELPQLTVDLMQLEDDLRELDRRVDRPLIGGIARNAPFVGDTVKSSQQLLDLGIELTEISRETSQIANEIKDAFEANGFMSNEPAVGPTWLDVVGSRRDDIYTLERRYDTALQMRAEIDVDELPGRALNTLQAVDDLLARGTEIRDEYFYLFPLLDTAFGAEADAHYLIMLQNGQELRGAGGFVGTYGMMTIRNGRIIELEINPISILNQAYVNARTEVLPAPAPIQKYLGQQEWLPHDANWSPDFPLVAAELNAMYEDTGSPPLQGIIAVNDSAVQAVLELIGPYEVAVDGRTEHVSHDNFIALIQSFRGGDERHKRFVSILGKSLIDQVVTAAFETKKSVFWTLRDSANVREIQVAMLDPTLQAEVARRGWDGALVPNPDTQTLVMTIANITGNKASQQVHVYSELDVSLPTANSMRTLTWTTTLSHQGDPEGPLEKEGFHRTWLQVYLPTGATLTELSRKPEPDEMTADPRAIGFHLELLPGAQETITITFDLPIDEPSLLLRRQSGLHHMEYHVTGGTRPGCGLDDAIELSHDYLVSFETCQVHVFEPGTASHPDMGVD